MASNDWFGKMKKRAQTLQETAKNKLDKLSETVDKKLKEVQDDIEKQRTKTESDTSSAVRVWRPSSDNPDGEIITEKPTPPPPPSAPSTEQKEADVPPTITEESEPTVETQQTTAAPVEEIVVVSRRAKGKKTSTKKSSTKQTDANNDIVDQETEKQLSNEPTDIIPTTVSITPTNEVQTPEIISKEISTDELPTSTPIESANTENIDNKTSVTEQLVQEYPTSEKLIDTSNDVPISENSPINEQLIEEVSVQENASTDMQISATMTDESIEQYPASEDQSKDEQLIEEVSVQEDTSKESSSDNQVQAVASVDEPTLVTNTEELVVENSTFENQQQKYEQSVEENSIHEDTSKEFSYDDRVRGDVLVEEPILATNTEELVEQHPTFEEQRQKDEPAPSTNNEEFVEEYTIDEQTPAMNTKDVFEEHTILNDTQIDEPSPPTNNEEFVEENSVQEGTQKELSADEQIPATNTEELVEEQQQKDEPISSTNNEEFIEENSIQDDTQKDEPTVSTNIEESIDGYPAFEEPQKDEPLLSTNNEEFVEEHSAQDDTQKDKPIVSTNIEETIDEYPVLEEQQQKDEPILSTNNEEFIEENLVQDDTQKDEPTVSTDIEESIDEYPAFEEPQKDEPLLSTDNAEFVEEHSAQDDAQKDEPIVSTNIEEVIDEYPVLEEQQQKDEPISSTNNEEFIEENSVQDDTEKDEPTVSTNIDEYPVSEEPQKDVSNDDQSTEEPLASENVSIIEPSTPIKDDQLTVESPISEDVQNVTDQLVEEHFASVDTEQLEKTQVDEPINSIEEQNVPDDDDVVRVEITTPENISTDASSDDFVVPTKNDEIPVDNFEAEYIQIKTPDDIISTDTQSDSEHILTDVPDENNTSTSNLISNAAAAVVEEEPSTPEPEVIISEVQNTPAPKQEVKKPKGKISIFDDSDSDDDFLNLSKKKKRPSKIPNIFDDEPKVTKAKLKTPLNEPDDIFEEFTISKISKQKSTTEPPKEPQQLSSIRSLLSTVGVNDDDDDDDDFLSSKPKVKIVDKHVNTTPPVPTSTDEINPFDEVDEPQSNIFGEEDEEEEETTNSIIATQVDESKVKPTVQSNIFDEEETTDSITITQIDESEVKPTVQSNLFDEEDELTTKVQVETNPFEEVKKPPRPIQRVQLEQNPFGDEDENENETNPFGEVEESIETNPFDDADEKNPFEEDEDESNPFREDDDDDTNPFNEVKRSVSNNPFDDDTDTTTVTTTKVQTFQPRYSVINYHPIPPGTKISQMNCSSSYIYFCTPDRRLFFAELHLEDPSQSFDWQQHGDLAERLVVSTSNQTVWRLFNKCLYIANDPINYPPFGSHWNTVKIDDDQSLLSMSISDQCGWYVKEDGTLWFIRTDDKTFQSTNVPCPYTLDIVFCFSGKVGVTTNIGEILIRAGCTYDCPEGGGWLFIEKSVGFIDDFVLLTNRDIMVVMDKKHRLWMNEWSTKKDFHEILLGDDFDIKKKRYLLGINTKLLYITDCEKGIYVYSDSLTGVQWNIVEESSPNLRLFAAFPNEDYVWAITSNRLIGTSAGQTLDKPAAVDSLTHASFVPNTSSKKSILWALDQSCGIYVRSDIEKDTIWEQADETQFEKRRRLVNIVCNNFGVWAVDDRGSVHFRHGHISASQHSQSKEKSLLPPAWITVPGDAKRFRSFVQVFCGPQDWMVYATDTKQNVYTRIGITATDRVGSSWKLIDDCSALELAISEHRLWLLTSHGQIQCRENISLENPIGTRSATLSGHFRSLTVSLDDSQVWALDAKRNLLKLDRLTVLFKK